MNHSKLDTFVRPIAQRLHANHMSRLGIANTIRLAYSYNRLKFGRQDRWRSILYQTELSTLLEENGGLSRAPTEMKDGWAIDTPMSLPHLDRTKTPIRSSPSAPEYAVRPKALSKLSSRLLDMGGSGEISVVPRLCDFERRAFRRKPLFAIHPCAFQNASTRHSLC